MQNRLIVSSSPHLRSDEAINVIMRDVVIALLPATMAGIYFFGMGAVKVILSAVIAAVATEAAVQKLRNQPISINDWSAVVTGLLLAFNIPATAPWWMPAVGSVFAIAIVKHAFGGLGHNFMNPALAARAMLLASWPVQMTNFIKPGPDAVSTATPLALIGGMEGAGQNLPSLFNLLIGNVGGCIGETSAILLILGGVYLIYRGVITPRIPVIYIATVAVLTFLLGGFNFYFMSYQVLAGGLMLGAIYMATDYSSSPVTPRGQVIFALGCGFFTSIIRLYGGYPEGVSYSILFMNVAAPLIDKYSRPRVFGEVK
ncbi:RnfABCDGE type electron transport complex subunit D [Geosporobacter ferrireducens]|uniref:Ion-translocating oxidoreductase complex subunit D n=1 Tax=Geosporobacter ferrireducens TaxID=1424294 RepID=A0A1D8GPB7_9FIRM|nr:RnfABCDGE type electron transport complex subunit D [Geosporobacter ferrireducens]AOT72742.1 NADH:ubiquinone oxidoreductase [Geosporobacter ferrireducens]MTI55156.1 RnfABCDGE type electron transport complex subunit D [Geosporobacter ferrireducens]